MGERLCAIVGSVVGGRTNELGLPVTQHQVDAARAAAKLLGVQLALAGYRLVVYSGDPAYIERYVVEGFLHAAPARDRSIEVIYPADDLSAITSFPQYAEYPNAFRGRPQRNPSWDISYFRSFARVDGIVLFGGGKTTLITGVLALAWRIPLVAVKTFGGKAEDVWELFNEATDLVTQDEIDQMAAATVDKAVAQHWVQSLNNQAEHKRTELAAQRNPIAAWLSIAITAVWLAVMVLAMWLEKLAAAPPLEAWRSRISGIALVSFVLFLPAMTGILGSAIRTLLKKVHQLTMADAALSLTAGFLIGLLSATDKVTSAAPPQWSTVMFSGIYGLLAGLTADAVWQTFLDKPAPIPNLTALYPNTRDDATRP